MIAPFYGERIEEREKERSKQRLEEESDRLLDALKREGWKADLVEGTFCFEYPPPPLEWGGKRFVWTKAYTIRSPSI